VPITGTDKDGDTLPRITAVKRLGAPDIVSTVPYSDSYLLRVSKSPTADITAAVFDDHPCEDTAGCDIARMLDDGYAYGAADALTGATDVHAVALMVDAHRFNRTLPADFDGLGVRERDEWWDSVVQHAFACPACNGMTMGDSDYTPTECASCLAPLPGNPDPIKED
jgi:hypothetical protein